MIRHDPSLDTFCIRHVDVSPNFLIWCISRHRQRHEMNHVAVYQKGGQRRSVISIQTTLRSTYKTAYPNILYKLIEVVTPRILPFLTLPNESHCIECINTPLGHGCFFKSPSNSLRSNPQTKSLRANQDNESCEF